MKIILIILTIFITSCKLNKIVNHHGVHDLENKSQKLSVNNTNINEIKKLLGPPSTTSYFDNDVLIYLERKTSSSKLLKLGKKKLISNNVLLLEINTRGILISKQFLNKEDLIEFEIEEEQIYDQNINTMAEIDYNNIKWKARKAKHNQVKPSIAQHSRA